MPEKRKPNILLNSKIAVGICLAVLFLLGLALVAQGFIDTRNYRDAIIDAVQKQTNRKVTIKGNVSVSLLPTPTLYIPGLELRDPASDKPAPAASVDLVSIHVTMMSVFSDHPRIASISLDHPVLELVRAEDNLVHWDWLNAGLLKALADNKDPGKAVSIEINNGRVLYHDTNTDKNTTIDRINTVASNGSRLFIGGSFQLYGHDLKFSFNTNPESGKSSGSSTPFQLNVSSGNKNTLAMKGAMDLSKDVPDINGQLALEVEDAQEWVQAKHQEVAEEKDLLPQLMNFAKKTKKEKTLLPLKISSDWSQRGLSIVMDKVQLEGMNSAGGGKIQLAWKEWKPSIQIDFKFPTLDYDPWKELLTAAFARKDTNPYNKVYHGDDELPENPLPQNIEMKLNVAADQLTFGTQSWQDTVLSMQLTDASVTVNQFNIKRPGDSTLSLFGVISPSATNDLRFEGSMETKGKSLSHMLTVFDDSAISLPETGFGEFFARSNIFVSAAQLRLSEADVELGELHLNGGLVAYFDAKPRIEADVGLKEISFDYFRDAWRERQKKSGQQDFFLKFDKGMNFNWLKKLQPTIDFRVNVDHFIFLDRSGEKASFRVYARTGDLGIYDINFVYPSNIMKGHFKLDVTGEQPSVDIALSVGTLNTDYFMVSPIKPVASLADDGKKLEIIPQSNIFLMAANDDVEAIVPPAPATGIDDIAEKPRNKNDAAMPGKRWPESLIDMSWMNGLSGVVDLNIGNLTHENITLENLKLQANLSNDLMTFKKFTFNYWGGQCTISGSMFGGKVPGFSISVSLLNAHLQQMLKELIGRDNIVGNVSLTSSLSTSGINYLSWVTQAEGKMALSGRGVTVKGINLPGVVDAVSVSRTASDVVNSVALALGNGSTTFAVDGNINIKNGILRTPGIRLNADPVLGNFMGEVKLVPWTMDFSTMFQFPNLSSETVPTMTVQLSGPLAGGTIRTDTSSLEAYVTKRIIGK